MRPSAVCRNDRGDREAVEAVAVAIETGPFIFSLTA
jgi:hypothetical protein